jgi:hypothetical protein
MRQSDFEAHKWLSMATQYLPASLRNRPQVKTRKSETLQK